jgi:hypothetical protein
MLDFDDEQPTPAETPVEAVLSHACVYLLALDDRRADAVRAFLRDEAASDPSLASDPARVHRLVERVLGAIGTGAAKEGDALAAQELRE